MIEPVYLSQHDYEAIAQAVGIHPVLVGVDHAKEAHRSLSSPFIKDEDLDPIQFAYVNAIRAHLAPVVKVDAKIVEEIHAPAVEPAPVVEASEEVVLPKPVRFGRRKS